MGRGTVGGAEIARGTQLQTWQHKIKIFFYDASMAEREIPTCTEGTPIYDLNLSEK